jgi:hemoglobin
MQQSVYEAVGGLRGLTDLARAWHERVLVDPVVSHAFDQDLKADHVERLAAYWAEALGGPARYSGEVGSETEVVRLHSGNGAHPDMDDRAIACFDRALDDIGVMPDSPLGHTLHDYFAWATRGPMAAYHRSAEDVPPGLSIARWSWEGLAS